MDIDRASGQAQMSTCHMFHFGSILSGEIWFEMNYYILKDRLMIREWIQENQWKPWS